MLHQLTFTRFIAAIAIVVFHYGQSVFPFNTQFLSPLFTNANIGVSYFFILSGFVMVIAYKSKVEILNTKDYYVNRFSRIYPVYILALIFTAVIIFIRYHEFDLQALLFGSMVLQAWIPKYALSLNSPGWSLSVEFLFYLVFPFCFNYFYRTYSLGKLFFFIIVIWLATQLANNYLYNSTFYKGHPSTSHNILFYFPLFHLNQFLIGNLTGLVFVKYESFKKNYDLHIVVLLLFTVATMFLFYWSPIHISLQNGLMAVLFAPFVLLLSLNLGRITKILHSSLFITLGEISYSIYILQYPTNLIVNYIAKSIHIVNPEGVFYLFVIILILMSGVSYYFIEIPLRNKIKKWYSDKKNRMKITAV